MRHGARVHSAEFDPTGRLVVTASWDFTARLWDAETGAPFTAPLGHADRVSFATFSPAGDRIVTASEDGTARVWDVGTGNPVGESFQHWARVTGVRFMPSGREVITGGGSMARIWSIRPGRPRSQIFRHRISPYAYRRVGYMAQADFLPGAKRLLSASPSDGTVRIWDRESGRREFSFDASVWENDEIAVDSTGGKIATVEELLSGKGRLRVWSAANHEEPQWSTEVPTIATAVIFTPDDRQIVVSMNDGAIGVWNAETAEQEGLPMTHDGGAGWLHFSPNGRWLVSERIRGTLRVWDWETRDLVATMGGEPGLGAAKGPRFTPDARFMVVPNGMLELHLFPVPEEPGRLGDSQPVSTNIRHSKPIFRFAISPDSRFIATASADGTARIWRLPEGQEAEPVGLPLQHKNSVVGVDFSPDGSRLVTSSLDGTVRVWDANEGLSLSEPLRHDVRLTRRVRFTPDGSQVLAADTNGTVRLWDVPPATAEIPEWLPDWAEAVVGVRLKREGSTEPLTWQEARDRIARAKAEAGDDYYGRILRWFYADPQPGAITPFSGMPIDTYVQNRIREGRVESLEEVLRVDPGNPEALIGLARKLSESSSDLQRAAYYAERATSNGAKMEDAEEILEGIRRKQTLASIMERLNLLRDQATELLAQGNLEQAESLTVAATLGSLLVRAELNARPLSQLPDTADGEIRKWVEAFQQPMILVAAGAEWQFLAPGQNPGSDWMGADYDDGDWEPGAAPLGFSRNGEDGERTWIRPEPVATTYYFRKKFDIAGSAPAETQERTLFLRIRCDDGAVVYLNGEEAVRVNMPEGRSVRIRPPRRRRRNEPGPSSRLMPNG